MCMHKVSLMWSYNSTDIYVHCMKEVKKGNKISLVIQKFIKNKLSKNYMHIISQFRFQFKSYSISFFT